jgi:hypothetical protein
MPEYTIFIWSFFLKNKNDVADTMIQFLTQLQKETKLKVEFIGCDNSRKNKQFQEAANAHPRMRFKFEYTAPGTPQQNGKIERKLATRSKIKAAPCLMPQSSTGHPDTKCGKSSNES